MPNRRDFLKSTGAAALFPAGAAAAGQPKHPAAASQSTGLQDRQYWLSVMERLAMPVLGHLSRHELRKAMPVETGGDAAKLRQYTHLEAISRLLVGLAPWMAASGLEGQEARLQRKLVGLAQVSLDAATDPQALERLRALQARRHQLATGKRTESP